MSAFAVPDHVGVIIEREDLVYIATLPQGPILRLDGAAAVIWAAALEDSAETLVDRVAATVGASSQEIADDVEGFIGTLVQRGLLRPLIAERY